VEETTEAEETTDSQEEDTEEETEENDVMSIGDYSDDVYSVQERLIELKYFDDSATGYFGQLTQQAVKDFQDYNEIENTGEVDDETETVLFSDDAIANPEATEEAEEAQEEEDSDTTATTEDVEENQEETVPVPSSSVVLESNKMASDALAGLTSDSDFSSVTENNSDGTGIIKWLIIVIAVMGAVFVVVLVNERKKAKRRSKHAMQRSRKYW
jgi:hypothetical protein